MHTFGSTRYAAHDLQHEPLITAVVTDMTTRSGLKKVHACLPSIQERLDETFKFAKRTRQTKAMGGVVAIYSKMCSLDAVLQNKLLENGEPAP